MKKRLISQAIACALLGLFGCAEASSVNVESGANQNSADNLQVNADAIYEFTSNGTTALYGILSQGKADFTGNSITINGSTTVDKQEFRGAWARGGKLVLGKEGSSIQITGSSNFIALGLVSQRPGASMVVNGQDLVVDLTLNGTEPGSGLQSYAYGIIVMNATTDATQDMAEMVINAKNTIVNVRAPTGKESSGVVAMSQGILKINGNLEVNATNAIVARGDAIVEVNKSGQNTVRLNGDIDFAYDKQTSGTKVDADVLVSLTGADSYWNGSPKVTWSTGKPESASTLEVNSLNLSFNDGATWNPVVIENKASENVSGQFGLAVNTLEVNNANINLSSADQVVAAQTIKGTGATITVPVSVSGDSATVGQFAYEVAEGTPEFQVNLTGITADEMTDNIRNDLAKAVVNGKVDYTAEGTNAQVSADAQVADQKQSVGEGSVAGKQTWSITNGQVDEASVVEEKNTVNDSIIDIASANYLAFRSQMNDVSARMGDLRTMSRVAGAWVRYFGGENKYSGRDMKEKYNTIQLGADGFIGNNFYLGGTLSYTDGEGTLQNGSTDDKNYNFGIYGGWLGDNGQFVDVVVKRHRLETDFDLYSANGLSDGSLDTWGTSLSVEAGWRFNCPNTGFYAEPQVEFQLGRVESVNFSTSQGVRVEQDGINSIIGRAGVAVGYVLPENKGALYAKASVLHDWDGKVESSFSRDGVNRTYTDDLGGTWGEFAIGGTYNPTENISAYGQVKTSTGTPVRNPWQFSVGVRYNF